MAPAITQNELDSNIWNACAGLSVQNHSTDSRVYYFPQGHAEHAASPPDLSCMGNVKPMVHCRVLSVRLLANLDTDEVFSKISLEPVESPTGSFVPGVPRLISNFNTFSPSLEEEEGKITSFAKILTPSDANNGGGFSVPRYCADSIFPPLNYNAEPPVQTISVTDVHGMVWEFRHIFRGTPRRHLLTTGWSKFVNHKKLVAGDSVVFMKNRSGELFVGIRRAARLSSATDCTRWNCHIKPQEDEVVSEGFSRSSKGRVSAESVLKAAELAGANRPFEVVFYPNAGSPDFVVKAEKVENSLSMNWSAGTRFKLAMESEDSSRMTCFYGTVSTAACANHGPFRGSPWRMLQVSWDDSEVLKNMQSVSPWLVEVVEATPSLQTPYPPPKKLRSSHSSELLTDGEGAPFFPMTGFTSSMLKQLNPSLFDPKSFPVGMQGARQNNIGISGFSNFLANDSHQMYSDRVYGSVAPQMSSVSTELNIGNVSGSDHSSPHSQGSVNFFGKERLSNQTCSPIKKAASTSSFQLFGKIIQTNQPLDVEQTNGGSSEDDSNNHMQTQSLIDLLDLPSLACKKLSSKLDVECQRVATIEACNL